MVQELRAHANLQDGLHFAITTSSGHTLHLDGAPEHTQGPSPLELLLVALAGCVGMTVVAILRKKRQDVQAYEIRVASVRQTEQPQAFVEITLEHIFTGQQLQAQAVERSLQLTEERYCPVSVMLSKAAKITHTYTLIPV